MLSDRSKLRQDHPGQLCPVCRDPGSVANGSRKHSRPVDEESRPHTIVMLDMSVDATTQTTKITVRIDDLIT